MHHLSKRGRFQNAWKYLKICSGIKIFMGEGETGERGQSMLVRHKPVQQLLVVENSTWMCGGGEKDTGIEYSERGHEP